MRLTAGRRPMVGILRAVVFAGSIAAPATVPLLSADAQIWDGYYLLAAGRPAVDGALAPFPGSLTASAPVRFTTFDGLTEHPADRLAQRLDARDPRFDPFLRSVADLFLAQAPAGEARPLAWLRSDLPPAGVLLRLALRSPAAALAVLDVDVGRRLLAACLVMAGTAAAAALAARAARAPAGHAAALAAGMAAPWAAAALNAGGMAVIAAAAVLPPLRALDAGASARAAAAVVATAAAAGLLLGGALVGAAVAAAACGSVALTLPRSGGRRAPPAGPPASRAVAALLAGALVAAATLLAAALPGARAPALRVPAPDAGGAALTWDALARLGRQDAGRAGVPTAADYVTHVAFQEGLSYGRPYRLPVEGERLTVSTFRFDADARRMVRRERVLATYDRRWLERVRADAVGAGRLLLAAGAVTVQRRWLADLARPDRQTRALILLALPCAAAAAAAAAWTRPPRAAR